MGISTAAGSATQRSTVSPEEQTDLTLHQGARLKLREHHLQGADAGRYLGEVAVALDPRVDAERTMAGIDEMLRAF